MLLVFALMLAMHWSARLVERQSVRLFGDRLHLYLLGSFGTMVHEASHVIACLVFRHRVNRVRWFDPRASDGSLGSVTHAYDPASAYQRLGTIVIGVSPLLAGGFVLLSAPALVLGLPAESLTDPTNLTRLPAWRTGLFTYLCLSVGGAMHVSSADLHGMRPGLSLLAKWLSVGAALMVVAWWMVSTLVPTAWATELSSSLERMAIAVTRWSSDLAAVLRLPVLMNFAWAMLLAVLHRIMRLVGF